MFKILFTILSASILFTACSGGGATNAQGTTPTSVASEKEFAYETQRDVAISISLDIDSDTLQKQVLFYESQAIDTSPVGDQVVYNNLLMEGVTNVNGTYTTHVTLGNHITTIWILIPALSYENNISIVDDTLVLDITQGQ